MGHVPIELWAVSKEDVLLPREVYGQTGSYPPCVWEDAVP